MNQSIRYIGLCFLLFATISCRIDESYFGLNDQAEILTFNLPNQIGAAKIDTATQHIVLDLPFGTDLQEITPVSINTSSLSSLSPEEDITQNFSDKVTYTVRAENGTEKQWEVTVNLVISEDGDQPTNSNFESWYTDEYSFFGKVEYQQIGVSKESDNFWCTPNEGSKRAGKAENNIPFQKSDGPAVRLTTIDVSTVEGFPPIAAGSLYSGTFNYGSNLIPNPYELPTFGQPFTARPKGFSISYRYFPGTGKQYRGINGDKVLPVDDQADAADLYVLLRNNDGNGNIQRIGTAWLRVTDKSFDPANNQVDEGWQTAQIEMIYGPNDQLPDYALPKASEYVSLNESGFFDDPQANPNEIVVVFSPSANGNDFAGVIDSELNVANFKLIY